MGLRHRIDLHVHFDGPLAIELRPPTPEPRTRVRLMIGDPMATAGTTGTVTATFEKGITPVPAPSGTSVTFTSSNTSVATVGTARATTDGFEATVSYLAAGSATIGASITVPGEPTFPQPSAVVATVTQTTMPTHVVLAIT